MTGRGYRPARSKYGAKKTTVGGERFDSTKEARRWQQLQIMERAGKINSLQRQVKYIIIPEHREPDTRGPRGGVKRGRVIERARYYVADFVYYDNDARALVVEDCKGFRTAEYKLKKALMLDRYGIRIKET